MSSLSRQSEAKKNHGEAKKNRSAEGSLRCVEYLLLCSTVIVIAGPLLLLSCGTGWNWPRLLPDHPGFTNWRTLLSQDTGLLSAMGTSAALACLTSFTATAIGLIMSRAAALSTGITMRVILFLPWIISPVVAAVSLYQLLAGLSLAGSLAGVVAAQLVFAAPFAAIILRDVWNHQTHQMIRLVKDLGGSAPAVWMHVIWPRVRRLLPLCLLQTALFSWLDYGIVSVIGGGRVDTITVRLFALLREAGLNQAALAAIMLMTPAIVFGIPLAVQRMQLPAILNDGAEGLSD